MKSFVAGELGMEACRQEMPLPSRDDAPAVDPCQHLDLFAGRLQERRADEDGVQRLLAERRNVQIGLEAVELAAEGVAPRRDIHQAQCWLALGPALGDPPGHQDRAGASAPQRHPQPRALANWDQQLVQHQQLADRRALAARNNQTIDLLKMFREPHLLCGYADAAESLFVLAKVALER